MNSLALHMPLRFKLIHMQTKIAQTALLMVAAIGGFYLLREHGTHKTPHGATAAS